MLKSLTDWRPTISLVPFSGVQFIDYAFDSEAIGSFRRKFVERIEARREDGSELRTLIPLTGEDEEDARRLGQLQSDDEEIPVSKERALEPFLDKWVPVPFLRILPGRGAFGEELYDRGPTNWARVRVIPCAESGSSHRVVFVFDTEIAARVENRPYLVPAPADGEDEVSFRFVAAPEDMQWFLSASTGDERGYDPQKWVDDWLTELFLEFRNAQRPGRPTRLEEPRRSLEHWARYLTFLALLDHAVAPRPVKLLDTLSANRYTPVKVDLVLDIGNSRTCGMLVESHPDQLRVDLNNSYVLELRDLGQPERVYREPFESRIEFSQASFGKEHVARRAGRGRSFIWPSLVRVGPEALRIVGDTEGTETTTGMSSPKRYLWDDQRVNQDWRFQEADYPSPGQEPQVLMAVRRYVNDQGDVISQIEAEEHLKIRRRDEASKDGTMRSRFSRSSLYSFMIAEIVYQALVLINDPAVRHGRRESDVPRRLRNVILTLPPATPLQEQQIMRSRVEAGIRLIWDLLGRQAVTGAERPQVSINWDEASCTQFVWLYSEITQKFGGQPQAFVEIMGKPRPFVDGAGMEPAPDARPEPSLRVASLDIGGGTTDLMITTYYVEANRALKPTQNFREGFRIAGDDIVKAVIEEVVVPALERQLADAGLAGAREQLKQLFGGDQAQMREQDKHRRRQFVIRVFLPVALALVRAYEDARSAPERAGGGLRVGDVLRRAGDAAESLDDDPELAARLFGYVEDAARAAGAVDYRVADCVIPIDEARLDAVIGRVMRQVLYHVGEAVWALDCDVLLLAGRPSRLRAIHDLVREQIAVTPDRIVAMDRYRVGTWYPFRARDNLRISDPKTTAAVGCMLCSLADPERADGGRLENFTLFTNRLRMRSTARFIGEMERTGQITDDKLLFADVDLDAKGRQPQQARIRMFAPLRIGFRQLPYERWTATPLYWLDFTASGGRLSKPLTVTIERADVEEVEEDGDADPRRKAEIEARRRQAEAMREAFTVSEVLDSAGAECKKSDVRLRLQTLGFEDSYWLDTGILDLR
ncbi:MAG: virulence factor SrfB [Geminicoccaceae bacterium]